MKGSTSAPYFEIIRTNPSFESKITSLAYPIRKWWETDYPEIFGYDDYNQSARYEGMRIIQ